MSDNNPLSLIFYSLPTPDATIMEEAFTAKEIEPLSPHRIGKDIKGNPVILISIRNKESIGTPNPITLEHISVRYNVLCRIVDRNKSSKQCRFTVIKCEDCNESLIDYFLRTIGVHIFSIGGDPSYKQVDKMVQNLIKLFRALNLPSKHTIQGLWAELFIISQASNVKFLLHSWHRDPADRYDFCSGKQYIEVKSCSGDHRIHHFSLEQLNPSLDKSVIICSLFVKPSDSGLTITNIMDNIQSKLRDDYNLLTHLYKNVTITLGSNWKQATSLKFDEHIAKKSISTYEIGKIPSVTSPVPLEVTEVRFKSNLSRIPPCNVSSLLSSGDLFEAVANIIPNNT